MKRSLMSLALFAALAGSPMLVLAQEQPTPAVRTTKAATVPDPAQQLEELARLFRAGDVAALARAAIPPSKWELLRVAYDIKRQEPSSDEDRARFAEKFARFLAPDAVDSLMVEIEPELEKARPQVPGALLMGFGAMHMAVTSPESNLTDEQRTALENAIPGIQHWASGTDFLSSATMRDALTLLTDAARRAGVNDLDQLKALPLDEVLRRAGPVLAAAKQAVQLYGLDVDAIADSLHVDVLSIDGETARVRTTITLFDAPVWAEHDLVLVEGRWYGKDAAVHIASHGPDDLEG